MSEISTPKICKDVERLRNAERLARALKPYLTEAYEPLNNLRGRGKDKRICQLNAAYKYCLTLEKKIQDLYANQPVPDELKLVQSTLSTSSSRNDSAYDDDLFQTPVQKNTSLSNDESIATVSSVVSSSTNTGIPVSSKRPNILSTISPICGPQDHYIDDSSELGEFLVKRRRLEDKPRVDVNNNVISQVAKSSKEPVLNNLEFRKHYFLRSTAIRIKNALSAATNEAGRRVSNRKINTSTHSSSRSSSLTTTPTETRDDVNSSTISSLMDNIDHGQLLKIDMPQDQLNNLFELNENERKPSFNFI